jgi:hypothetical protein
LNAGHQTGFGVDGDVSNSDVPSRNADADDTGSGDSDVSDGQPAKLAKSVQGFATVFGEDPADGPAPTEPVADAYPDRASCGNARRAGCGFGSR